LAARLKWNDVSKIIKRRKKVLPILVMGAWVLMRPVAKAGSAKIILRIYVSNPGSQEFFSSWKMQFNHGWIRIFQTSRTHPTARPGCFSGIVPD
jgi:hypothetical protein